MRALILSLLIGFLAPFTAGATSIVVTGADGGPNQDGEYVSTDDGSAVPIAGDLDVTANGGDGGDSSTPGDPAGDGGGAYLYGVLAQGIDLIVDGRAVGGDGGDALVAGAPSGSGGRVSLRDAVDGIATDSLDLEQVAEGGDAGSGSGGAGGDAISVLERTKSLPSFEMNVRAEGGAGSGGAWAEGIGHNLGGEMGGEAVARGGHGKNLDSLDGGNAVALGYFWTEGDGNDVQSEASAFGGDAALEPVAFEDPDAPVTGRGGGALSRSNAIARGDSEATASAFSQGGEGFGVGARGTGGDAIALALAENAGDEDSNATAFAVGGDAGGPASLNELGPGHGGNAFAFAEAYSEGTVMADATAAAGSGSVAYLSGEATNVAPGGLARARARGRGGDGELRATAYSAAGPRRLSHMASTQAVLRNQVVEAQTNAGTDFPTDPADLDGLASFVAGTLGPLPDDVAAALVGNDVVADALSNAEIVSLSHFALAYRVECTQEPTTLGGAMWLEGLGASPGAFAYRIGFLDPVAIGNGFEELRLAIVTDAGVILEETFTEVTDAVDYLTGLVVDTDPTEFLHVDLEMDVAPGAGGGFETGVVVALVPEPGTALLMGIGLVGLSWMGRRR